MTERQLCEVCDGTGMVGHVDTERAAFVDSKCTACDGDGWERSLGQVAYTAYVEHQRASEQEADILVLPAWEYLTASTQRSWEVAVGAAFVRCGKSITHG